MSEWKLVATAAGKLCVAMVLGGISCLVIAAESGSSTAGIHGGDAMGIHGGDVNTAGSPSVPAIRRARRLHRLHNSPGHRSSYPLGHKCSAMKT